jgi:hypothetical protein
MLEARPRNLFSRDFFIEANGREVSKLEVPLWREAGAFTIEGQPYRIYREGWMSGAFLLESGGRQIGRAIKPSAFRSQFDLELDGSRYSLQRTALFGRTFTILRGGAEVGSIRPVSVFSRRALIDLPSDWPLSVKVFVFWLVLVIWNRDRSAAAS